MAKPDVERLRLASLFGVGCVALVAVIQLALLVALFVAPSRSADEIRFGIRIGALSGAIVILLVAFALYLFVMRPAEKAWRYLIGRADERRQRYSAIFEEHPDALCVYNLDGTIVRANPTAVRLLGFTAASVGEPYSVHIAPGEHQTVNQQYQYACAGRVAKFETTFLNATGEEIPVNCYLVPTIVNGQVVSIVGSARDLREIKRALARERVQVERISELATIKSEYASRPQEQIQRILEFTAQTLGQEEGAVSFIESGVLRVAYSASPGVPVGLTLDLGETFSRHMYGSRDVLAIADVSEGDWREDQAVLKQAWKSYIGTTIFVEGQPFGVISFTRRSKHDPEFDVADRDLVRIVAALVGSSLERVRNEVMLQRQAHFDSVTGLANRSYFEDQLRQAVARAKRHGGFVRLHFIDLDGFKEVNDELGHAAGDETLRIVAARLRTLVREDDLVARLGGDEFVVLESSYVDEAGSTALGNRIVGAIAELMYIAGKIVRVGASVGVASFPHHAKTEAELLARADSAMYAAKTAGKGAVRIYCTA